MIDELDLKILSIIQQDARTPDDEIARQTGAKPSLIAARIRELERRRVIRGYEAQLQPQALGLTVTAFIFVTAEYDADAARTANLLAEIPEVQEVHRVSGEDGYLVKVRVRNMQSLGELLKERFDSLGSVVSTHTTVVLKTIKETDQLPLKSLATHALKI